MIKNLRILLWGLAVELQYHLYPFDVEPEDEYYIKIKNDDTGEEYFVMDWIKSHNEKINNLEDKMIWVIHELNSIKNK